MTAFDEAPGKGRDLVREAQAARGRGEPALSLDLYRRAAAAFDGHASGRAHCLRHMGDLAREMGQPDEARAALREAERLYRDQADDRLALANTLRLIGLVDGDRTRWREARTLYEAEQAATGLDLQLALKECDAQLA